MKWDLKSIITMIFTCVLALIIVALICAVIIGVIPSDDKLISTIVLLFSNSVTMILTYFFAKKKEGKDNED